MKHERLRRLLFWALCSDLGYITKKLVSPGANAITDALRIPGGISTGFSLMFLVIGLSLANGKGGGLLMGAVQSVTALVFGQVGAMGALMPVGYILPGIAIDLAFALSARMEFSALDASVLSSAVGSLTACMTANMIVFRLSGWPLALYASLSSLTGALCGVLAYRITKRIRNALNN